jgi:hypothetical protein
MLAHLPSQDEHSSRLLKETFISRVFMIWTAKKSYSEEQIKKNELSKHVASVGAGDFHTVFLVGKAERKRQLGKPRRKWEGNIKTRILRQGMDV